MTFEKQLKDSGAQVPLKVIFEKFCLVLQGWNLSPIDVSGCLAIGLNRQGFHWIGLKGPCALIQFKVTEWIKTSYKGSLKSLSQNLLLGMKSSLLTIPKESHGIDTEKISKKHKWGHELWRHECSQGKDTLRCISSLSRVTYYWKYKASCCFSVQQQLAIGRKPHLGLGWKHTGPSANLECVWAASFTAKDSDTADCRHPECLIQILPYGLWCFFKEVIYVFGYLWGMGGWFWAGCLLETLLMWPSRV